MKLYSDKLLFNHVDGICLAAYQAKNKNPVMLFSSSHADTLVAADETKKPVMILDYYNRKEGVDMLDENLEQLWSRRKTIKWPLFFFYNIFDRAANKAFFSLKITGEYTLVKQMSSKKLTLDLAKPAVGTRLSVFN